MRIGLLAGSGLLGQESSQDSTRFAEIEAERDRKAANLAPEMPSRAERNVVRWEKSRLLRDLLGGADGFSMGMGGLVPGAGFAGGPQYRQHGLFDGMLDFGAGFRASTKGAYAASGFLRMPNLANGRVFVETRAAFRNLNQQPYYGPGSGSRKEGRSAYRLEDTLGEIRTGIRPLARLRLGILGGFYSANIGRGDTSTYISTDSQFTPSVTPGIDRQGSFWRSGAFANYDWRRGGSESTGGGQYRAEFVRNSDRDFGAYSHSRFDLDGTHYQPFWNDTHVIALHAHSTLTDIRAGQQLPFYLQPTLGGPDDLRGFRPYRFYGDNSVVFNLEYRWQASAGLDVAAFADGGKVFNKWEQLNFHGLESSFGAGLRFKMRQNLAARLDVGVSREGVQVWFRFNNAF